jgi:hypothetical protein
MRLTILDSTDQRYDVVVSIGRFALRIPGATLKDLGDFLGRHGRSFEVAMPDGIEVPRKPAGPVDEGTAILELWLATNASKFLVMNWCENAGTYHFDAVVSGHDNIRFLARGATLRKIDGDFELAAPNIEIPAGRDAKCFAQHLRSAVCAWFEGLARLFGRREVRG